MDTLTLKTNKTKEIWGRFIQGLETPEDISQLDSDIYQSWLRSKKYNVNPREPKSSLLTGDDLEAQMQKSQPLIRECPAFRVNGII